MRMIAIKKLIENLATTQYHGALNRESNKHSFC